MIKRWSKTKYTLWKGDWDPTLWFISPPNTPYARPFQSFADAVNWLNDRRLR